MKISPPSRKRLLQFLGFLTYSVVIFFLFWGIPLVPFHPDESTQLFMSSDFELLFRSPLSMAWSLEKEMDLKQTYRELDAPLTRYLIGLGLWLANLPALPVDWDWSKTWDENREASALPSSKLLFYGRMMTTLLLPVAMLLIFLTGSAFGGQFTGFLSGLFLGMNALVLIHGRRAMAESALIMGISLALWGLMHGERHPWLAGIGAALAFNAKQSAIAIVPVSMIAIIWITEKSDHINRIRLMNVIKFSCIFILIFVLLNPLVWLNPIQAIQASWDKRQGLTARQLDESLPEDVSKNQLSLGRRTALMIANLFIIPPMFAEVGNYSQQTKTAERNYMNVIGHNLGRGFIAGGILLALTFMGILLGFRRFPQLNKEWRRKYFLLVFAMISQVVLFIFWVPLPWQRYVIPMVPYACIWPAFAIHQLLSLKAPSI